MIPILLPSLIFLPSMTSLLPPDASLHGLALDRHLALNLWIFSGLFVLANLILVVGVRLGRRPEASAERAFVLEYGPLFVLTILFALLTMRAERLWAQTRYTGADPEALQVEVTGMQFAWYFRYPGKDARFGVTRPQMVEPGAGNPLGIDAADPAGKDDFISSELVLPAGREVDLRIEAQDVIHGFSVPSLRVKQNAVPGQTMHIHLTPTRPGTYAILCTQVCGLGHYRMGANLRIVTADEYAAWVSSKEAAVTP